MKPHTQMSSVSLSVFAAAALSACSEQPVAEDAAGSGAPEEPSITEPAESSTLPTDPSDLPPTSEIIGGNAVNTCEWPSTVALLSPNGGLCTGTLIHPEVVLYAAHCGDEVSDVVFGEDVRSEEGVGFAVKARRCTTFPGWRGESDDVAICTLAQPATGVPIVPPLMGCETGVLQPGKSVTLVGFGTDENEAAGAKREVTTAFAGITEDEEAVIGGDGKSACFGDSGGPAFVQLDDGTWRAFGIVSRGPVGCSSGAIYGMMHVWMPWFEEQSGLDLTPCTDAQGNWDPDGRCTEFPLQPMSGSGTSWAAQCGGGPVSGASATCGSPIDSGNPQPQPQPEPQPQPAPGECENCGTFTGSLSGRGDRDIQPNGTSYAAAAGQHRAVLSGPAGADFDLYLLQWSGSAWTVAARSESNSSSEAVTFTGRAGEYVWVVESYGGSGSYTLQLQTP